MIESKSKNLIVEADEMANNPEGDNAMNTVTLEFDRSEPQTVQAEIVETSGDAPLDDFADRIVAEMGKMPVAPSVPGKPEPVPAGDYVCMISDAHVKEQAQGSYFLVIVNMVIISGEFKGHGLTKYYHLKTQKAVNFFKKEMLSIGFVAKGSAELPDLTASLSQTNVMASVAFNESGNRIVYLKAASIPKKSPEVRNQLVW